MNEGFFKTVLFPLRCMTCQTGKCPVFFEVLAIVLSTFLCAVPRLDLKAQENEADRQQDTLQLKEDYRNLTREILVSDSIRLVQLNDSTILLERNDSVYILSIVEKTGLIKIPRQAPQPYTDLEQAQPEGPQSLEELVKASKPRVVWSERGTFNINISNVGFSRYWAQGGESAISGGVISTFNLKRESEASVWESNLKADYAITRLQGRWSEKTGDDLKFWSQYGLKINEKWNFSGRFHFDSQFDKGYRINRSDGERLEITSAFMAPGRFEISTGIQSIVEDKATEMRLTNNFSPASGKITVVLSDTVNATRFGVQPGEKVFSEIGMQFVSFFTKRIIDNVTFQNNLKLFANYERPQNVDVNWETLLVFKINKYMNTNFATNLIYDDDIIFVDKNDAGEAISQGPRVQFNHRLFIGVSFIF